MKIDRTKSIIQLLNKLPFENKYLNNEVVDSLKNEGPEEVEIEFFNPTKYLTNQEVLAEYKQRNLESDLGALITLLIDQPELVDEKKYIGVQLEDNIFASFYRFGGERYVDVSRDAFGWHGVDWFGGRKSLNSGKLGTSDSLVSWPLDELTINGIKYKKV